MTWAIIVIGIWLFISYRLLWGRRGTRRVSRNAGWIYFMSVPGQPDAPVKIGRTQRDPTADRLPEIRTMSPFPLRIIWKFHCDDAVLMERHIHDKLAEWRLHGEWFERDPALMYISHLKGEL